jgi:transcriptional regulator GlxA family with amidase domain
LPEVPSLRSIAERLAVSEKTLARRVRQATGKSSQDLLQSIRWRHAKRLLETTRLSLEEVAAQVGYADATALRKLTRKIVGTSPGRLRQSML